MYILSYTRDYNDGHKKETYTIPKMLGVYETSLDVRIAIVNTLNSLKNNPTKREFLSLEYQLSILDNIHSSNKYYGTDPSQWSDEDKIYKETGLGTYFGNIHSYTYIHYASVDEEEPDHQYPIIIYKFNKTEYLSYTFHIWKN